jgi:hypothetical protein
VWRDHKNKRSSDIFCVFLRCYLTKWRWQTTCRLKPGQPCKYSPSLSLVSLLTLQQ